MPAAIQAPSILPVLGVVVGITVALCYQCATPVPQNGIALHPLIPARAAALTALVLAPEWASSIAFAAGTFDGIDLSGLAATLLVPGF